MATPSGGYRNQAGDKVPSVTTILSRFKDSGGLLFWSYKRGRAHEAVAWKNRICRWVAEVVGAMTVLLPDAVWRKLLSAESLAKITAGSWEPEPECERLYDEVQKAANSGSIAHDLIENFIKRQADPDLARMELPEGEPKVLENAANAFAQFQEWFAQNKITITETETGSMSERHQFGGTLDGLGKDAAGRWVLLDWKTSGAIYPEYLLQLAAYSILLEENFGIKTERHYIVRVAKENADFNHGSFTDLEEEKRTFLLMRELYSRIETTNRRCK